MTIIIAIFGLLIAALSAWGLFSPKRMIDKMLTYWHKPSGIYLAIGFRVVLGVLFILAAPDTRWPIVYQVLGWLMLIAAVFIVIMGKERLTRFIMWWVEMPPVAVRTWLVIGFVAGLLIAYGAT